MPKSVARRCGCASWYCQSVRKWLAAKMAELGIPTTDFAQGTVPRSISVRHHLKLPVIGDREYGKYAEWIEETLAINQGR